MTSSLEKHAHHEDEPQVTSNETYELVAWLATSDIQSPMPSLSETTLMRLGDVDDAETAFVAGLARTLRIEDEDSQNAAYMYLCGYADDEVQSVAGDGMTLDEIGALCGVVSLDDATVVTLHHASKTPVFSSEEYAVGEVKGEKRVDDLVGMYFRDIGKYALLDAQQEVELAKDIEAGVYAAHLLEERADLTPDRRRELTMMTQAGTRAYEHMIAANTRWAVNLARRHSPRESSLTTLDSIQNANIGLIRAVQKFDYTKGVKFSTYSAWWIRQAIAYERAHHERTIRIPVHVCEKIHKMNRIEREYVAIHGESPDELWLAEELDVSPEKVRELKDVSRDTMSLNMLVGDDENAEMIDFVSDEHDPTTDSVMSSQLQEDVRDMLGVLSERNRRIAEMKFGFADGVLWTNDAIGRELKLSRETVRLALDGTILPTLRRHAARRFDLTDLEM